MVKIKLYTAVAALALMLMLPVAPLLTDSSDATSEAFDITYTLKGNTHNVHFDGPVDKVIVFGYAAALTVLDTDKVSKLYACDEYADDAYAEKGLERQSKVIAKLSSSNVDAIFSQIMQAYGDGEFSKDDAIILTTMSTAAENVRSKLAEQGFTHIVFYGSMSEYADIISCVSDIEKILGSGSGLAAKMEKTLSDVTTAIKDTTKKDAIFAWYLPSSGWGYGNKGSLSVSMIDAAGGNNIGYTADSSESIIYNKSGLIQKLADSPEAVIFLDSGYIRSYGGSVEKFIEEVLGGSLGDHKLCVSEHAWNNSCPESADGVQKMASVLHPDEVSSDVKVYTAADFEDKKDNTLLYVGIGVAAVVVVLGLILFLRMKH